MFKEGIAGYHVDRRYEEKGGLVLEKEWRFRGRESEGDFGLEY